jgi:diacylglycerol kinase family enzyme/membrane-associated phospholipid phosphatase
MDENVGRRIAATQWPTAVDRGLRGLSEAADGGKLWWGVAGGLALTGAKGRSAARTAMLSLGCAALAANLIAKPLAGTARPTAPFQSSRATRRLARFPRSTSWPSGHTANAVAFATATALVSPARGLAVAPVAGAVAFSRLHVGAHWLSDVLGGAAIGAGSAVAVDAVRRRVAERHAGSSTHVDLPALPDGAGLYLIVNPHSGPDSGPAARLDEVVLLQFLAAIPRADVHTLTEDDDVEDLMTDAARSGRYTAIGAAGGDGTLGVAAAVAADHGIPFFVAPHGTLNHFARALGLDHGSDSLDALAHGTGRSASLAEVRVGSTRIPMLNTFSAGVYPEIVERRDERLHQLPKAVAAVVAGATELAGARPTRWTVDDEQVDALSVFIGNGDYGAPGAPLPGSRVPGSHTLDVWLLGVTSGADDWSQRVPGVRRRRGATTLRLDGAERVAVDGEIYDVPPGRAVTLEIRDRPVSVYAPGQDATR